MYTYKPKGVCAVRIQFDLDGDKVRNVVFTGGCQGNHTAIGRLIEGMTAEEAIARCEGIQCGFRNTSCADQLAKGIREAIEQNA